MREEVEGRSVDEMEKEQVERRKRRNGKGEVEQNRSGVFRRGEGRMKGKEARGEKKCNREEKRKGKGEKMVKIVDKM